MAAAASTAATDPLTQTSGSPASATSGRRGCKVSAADAACSVGGAADKIPPSDGMTTQANPKPNSSLAPCDQQGGRRATAESMPATP